MSFPNPSSSGASWSAAGAMYPNEDTAPPGSAYVNQSMTGTRLYLNRFIIPRGLTVVRLGCNVTVVGTAGVAAMELGLYADDGTGNNPTTLIVDGGSIDASVLGFASVAVNVPLPAGIVWTAILSLNSPATIPSVSALRTGIQQAAFFSGNNGLNVWFAAGQTSLRPTLPALVRNPESSPIVTLASSN